MELVTISGEEQKDYLKLMDEHSKIGKGEIESMVVCRKRGFSFSSFDKKAISMAKESGVKVIVAGAIFKGFLLKDAATKKEVLKIRMGTGFWIGKALAHDVSILVTLDADGQHNPDEIPNLLTPIMWQEADLINGSRFLEGHNDVRHAAA